MVLHRCVMDTRRHARVVERSRELMATSRAIVEEARELAETARRDMAVHRKLLREFRALRTAFDDVSMTGSSSP